MSQQIVCVQSITACGSGKELANISRGYRKKRDFSFFIFRFFLVSEETISVAFERLSGQNKEIHQSF